MYKEIKWTSVGSGADMKLVSYANSRVPCKIFYGSVSHVFHVSYGLEKEFSISRYLLLNGVTIKTKRLFDIMSTFLLKLNKDDKFIKAFWKWFDELPKETKLYYWNNDNGSAAEQKFLYSYHMKKLK